MSAKNALQGLQEYIRIVCVRKAVNLTENSVGIAHGEFRMETMANAFVMEIRLTLRILTLARNVLD